MDSLRELLYELGYPDFVMSYFPIQNEADKLNKLTSFVNTVNSVIKESSFEKTVAIIDFFNDCLPEVVNLLLKEKDSKIMRAQLLLEHFNGINPLMIKHNVPEATMAHMRKAIDHHNKGLLNMNTCNVKYSYLNEYLMEFEDDEIEKNLHNDLELFGNNLSNVDGIIFANSSDTTIPTRSDIINMLFESKLSIQTLSKIYDEVLSKNVFLKSFDYSRILLGNEKYEEKIKGLYSKIIGSPIFRAFSEVEFTPEEYIEMFNSFRQIVELNKDDEAGLRYFFGQLKNTASVDMLNHLETEDFYKKYANTDWDLLYEDNLNKLLNGRKDIDKSLIESIGTYKGFIENYNVLLDNFIQSDDEEYKDILIVPLIGSLIEIQKERNNLDFKVEYVSNESNDVCGEYNRQTNTLFINLSSLGFYKEKKEAFLSAVISVFHEVRHAYQYKIIENSDEISYENLLMSIDYTLTHLDGDYYHHNYHDTSFERDASEMSYVDTMTFFRQYPEIQKLCKFERINKNELVDFVRKNNNLGEYVGIVSEFIRRTNMDFEQIINNPDIILQSNKSKEELLQEKIAYLNKYPVIKQFFDFDRENLKISPKSVDYFKDKLDSLDNEKDKEEIYSIKTFMYALKVGNLFEERHFSTKSLEDAGKDVSAIVGLRPSR